PAGFDLADDAVHQLRAHAARHALSQVLVEQRGKRLPAPAAVEQLAAEWVVVHLLEQRAVKRRRDPLARLLFELLVLSRWRGAQVRSEIRVRRKAGLNGRNIHARLR